MIEFIGPALGIGFVIPMFIIVFIALTFIIWIWALIDCIRSDLKTEEKLLWVIVIVFLQVIGAIVYFIFAGRGEKMAKNKTKNKKLYRSSDNKVLGGVCAGIGEYADVDPTMIRLLWVIVTVFTGFFPGILAYIIAWIIMPEK